MILITFEMNNATGYNIEEGIPLWTAYTINKFANVPGTNNNSWRSDPRLRIGGCNHLTDFTESDSTYIHIFPKGWYILYTFSAILFPLSMMKTTFLLNRVCTLRRRGLARHKLDTTSIKSLSTDSNHERIGEGNSFEI